jgi:hypothetical protein
MNFKEPSNRVLKLHHNKSTTASMSLKNIRTKESPVPVITRTLDGFDGNRNKLVVLWLILIFFKFFENHGCIYQDWAFEFWRTMIIHKPKIWSVIFENRHHES